MYERENHSLLTLGGGTIDNPLFSDFLLPTDAAYAAAAPPIPIPFPCPCAAPGRLKFELLLLPPFLQDPLPPLMLVAVVLTLRPLPLLNRVKPLEALLVVIVELRQLLLFAFPLAPTVVVVGAGVVAVAVAAAEVEVEGVAFTFAFAAIGVDRPFRSNGAGAGTGTGEGVRSPSPGHLSPTPNPNDPIEVTDNKLDAAALFCASAASVIGALPCFLLPRSIHGSLYPAIGSAACGPCGCERPVPEAASRPVSTFVTTRGRVR